MRVSVMTHEGHSEEVSKPSRLLPWYVAQLKPNAEAIAKRNLERQGLKVFAPFEEVTIRKANRLTEARRPLFPGYLFVSFDPRSVRWRTVNSTLGVNRLISFSDNHPAQMPPALMLSLEKSCDASGKLLPPAMLEAGKIVRIIRGPFADFVGKVQQLAPDQRIWVLLDVLGRSTRVALQSKDLRVADH